MTETNHERWSEDIAAYLLGALEPGEVAELERHAEGCERCQAEIRWMTPAVDTLPECVERFEPPRELRERVMAEVRFDAEPEAVFKEDPAAAGIFSRASSWLRELGSGPMGLRPVAGFAAAILVVAAVAGFAIGGGIGSDSSQTSTVVTGKAPGVTAKVVSTDSGGTLHLANVKQIPDDRVLEAWVQRDGEVEPVEALFVPDRNGQASTELPDMDGVELVMVTTEPKGGSESPTSAPIVTVSVQ
ncbi:MAG TPA: anti-sigma factor [Solirubrobacterales bacterium]|jgi:anti-sigma factor RsiW|nr:anti-sigma factor [Solirubrobacterales bacterium]